MQKSHCFLGLLKTLEQNHVLAITGYKLSLEAVRSCPFPTFEPDWKEEIAGFLLVTAEARWVVTLWCSQVGPAEDDGIFKAM